MLHHADTAMGNWAVGTGSGDTDTDTDELMVTSSMAEIST